MQWEYESWQKITQATQKCPFDKEKLSKNHTAVTFLHSLCVLLILFHVLKRSIAILLFTTTTATITSINSSEQFYKPGAEPKWAEKPIKKKKWWKMVNITPKQN